MSAPLYNKLKNYAKENIYPFHMPGHKRNLALGLDFTMDITEIDGFDNLHQAQGVIAEAQQEYAAMCGADETFFLVNGSTCGLEAAVLSVCGQGETVIVARNCHRSVYSGLVLAGSRPVYLTPEVSKKFGFCLGLSVKKVEQAILEHPEAKAVILTSPTYEGMISDIKRIGAMVHQHHMILIVDEAHGAHLGLFQDFPSSAIQLGADLVVQSTHKTLPAPTQTAVLHVKGQRIDRQRLRNALALTQTSSPSYLFLAAVDRCRAWIEADGKILFDNYRRLLVEYRQKFLKFRNIQLITEQSVEEGSVFQLDLGKLVFFLPYDTYSGTDVGDFLRRSCGIELEMCGLHHVIAMTTCADTRDGLERLYQGLKQIDHRLEQEKKVQPAEFIDYPLPEMVMLPREAFFAISEEVTVDDSVGWVSCDFLIPYPPGIPLVVPGERISPQIVTSLVTAQSFGVSIVGIKNELVRVCRKKG